MKSLIKPVLLLTLALFLGWKQPQLHAQASGKIYGQIVDAETGETLIGATARLDGTLKGAATDIDGRYSIEDVEPGVYTVIFSFIGFQTKVVEGVEITDGESIKLDVPLAIETFDLGEEVIVTAQAIKSSEGALLRVRQKAVSFSDVISAESISKQGLSDAAGVMKKVVGASVVGGKYVYVRGLGERYSTTHMNGMELPTADPDKKSFQMDLIPAGLIENIVTLKTFTPDKPGNFSGGLVDITTKDFPEELMFDFSASTSYNSQVNFENGLLGQRSGTDWLGFDDGLREMPSIINNLRASNTPIPNLNAGNDLDSPESVILNDVSRAFNNEMIPVSTTLPLNHSFSLSTGNQINTSIGKIGYSGSLTYSRSIQNYTNGQVGRYLLVGEYQTTEELFGDRIYSDNRTDDNVDWGVLVNLAYIPHPNHKFNFSYFKTQSVTHTGRDLSGFWQDVPNSLQLSSALSFEQRSLNSFFLSGKNVFTGLNNITLDWKLASAENTMETPDLRFFSRQANTSTVNVDGQAVDTVLYSNPASLYPRPARFYRDLSESGTSATADITIPLGKNSPSKFKTGFFYDRKERNFQESRFDILDDEFSFRDSGGDAFTYFGTQGIIDTTLTGRRRGYDYGTYIVEGTEARNSYSADGTITAFYGMLDLFITDQLRFIGGIRFEQTDIEAISADSILAQTPTPDSTGFQGIGRLDIDDILPSASLVYSINDNFNIRTAFSKTLARPTFRELMPFVTFDFVGDFLFQGNSQLERTLITNYDVRFEWFTGPGEILALSFFYKDLENPMERVIRNDLGNNAASIQNVETGRVQGLEFEARKNLGFIHEKVSNFSLSGNLTLVHSEVDISEIELAFIRAANPEASATRQLFGQSPYIINFDLAYQNDESGLSTNLSFNRFGDRLAFASGNATPNIFERAYSTLNWNLSKPLTKNLTLGLKAQNLLNPDIQHTYRFKGEDFVFQSFRRGVSFSASISYSL